MPEKLSGIIVIAQPGRTLAGLQVLLGALFPAVPIEQTTEIAALRLRVESGAAFIALIDAGLPAEQAWTAAVSLRAQAPGCRVALLVHDQRQAQRAAAAGLEALLLPGLTAASLAEALGDWDK